MRLITKGELCRVLGLQSVKSGRLYYHQLNTQYFTDEILRKLKLTRSKYRRMKVFNAVQTQEIMKLFRIGEAERAE
jgi:hypothetical protein